MSAVIFAIGLFIFLAHLFVSVFERTKVPDALLLVAVGILIGPVLGWVSPQDFGKPGAVLSTVALIVILFEGGNGLDLKLIGGALRDTSRIAFGLFVVSVILVAVLARWVGAMDWTSAFISGAILGGTSAAVVVPMIRVLAPGEHASTILVLESALTDVLCIVFTFGLLDAYRMGELQTGRLLGQVLASFLMATLIGVLGAAGWAIFLKRVRSFPNTIFTTFAYLFVIYGVAEYLGFSGPITALSFGVAMTNLPSNVGVKFKGLSALAFEKVSEVERTVFSEAVFLLKTFFFIFLGSSLRFGDRRLLLLGALVTIVLFTARALAVRYWMPRSLSRRDAALMASMGAKGLAAAVLATIPMEHGLPGGQAVQDVANAVVLWSIVACSGLTALVESRFHEVYTSFFSAFPAGRALHREPVSPLRSGASS
jgi:potassium/hydrogen antiporter